MKGCKKIGDARTKELYGLHISGSIPFLHDDEKKYQVEGELYEVDEKELANMDIIESNGEWYHRKDLIVLAGGVEHRCQAYFNNEKAIPLDHGSFRKYIDDITKAYYCR